MLCAQNSVYAIAALVALVLIVIAKTGNKRLFEGYGAANEPHAGLNPAASPDSSPRDWEGVRADTPSALVTKTKRG
jgi:hypothetical protein